MGNTESKTESKLEDPSVSSLWTYVKICTLSAFLIRKTFIKLKDSNVDNPNLEQNTILDSQEISDTTTGKTGPCSKDIPSTTEVLNTVDSQFKSLIKALSTDVSGFSEIVEAGFLSRLEKSKDVTTALKNLEDAILKETQSDLQKLKKEKERIKEEIKVLQKNYTAVLPADKMSPRLDAGASFELLKATLYSQNKSEISEMVANEIRNMLKTQLSTQKCGLQLSECNDATNIDPSNKEPVIVVCFSASRLGTDVSSALRGIKHGRNVAVMILHHKELHAQPSQSSDKVLMSEEYKELGGIFDMAFTSKQGIYQCDMNNRAVIELANFIRKSNDEQNKNQEN